MGGMYGLQEGWGGFFLHKGWVGGSGICVA